MNRTEIMLAKRIVLLEAIEKEHKHLMSLINLWFEKCPHSQEITIKISRDSQLNHIDFFEMIRKSKLVCGEEK